MKIDLYVACELEAWMVTNHSPKKTAKFFSTSVETRLVVRD